MFRVGSFSFAMRRKTPSILLAALPMRSSMFMPVASFCLTSSYVEHSWSLNAPATRYALSPMPSSMGAWPSMGRLSKSLSLSSISWLQFITLFASITSPRPSMRLLCMNCSMSSATSFAPLCSNGVAGTQEGSMKSTLSGSSSVSLYMARMPAAPATFAISCGSAITVVVPWGIITFMKEEGITMLLSMCTCASMKPGAR